MENIEKVEISYPQSIIQRENEPITALIKIELLVKQFESRIKELENNTTTMIYNTYNIQHTMCCAFHVENIFNFCPNCGRKIIR